MESKIKKAIIILFILIILIILGIVILRGNTSEIKSSDTIVVVPTLLDEITSNSAWCGTFQLVWNDMQNEVVKQDIVFTPQLQIATNLNKQTFTEDNISEEYYFKSYGLKTLDLKGKIENGISEKFNQTSGILDQIDWAGTPQSDSGYNGSNFKKYLFYVMLYREFTFKYVFDELDNDVFKGTEEKYKDVEYFGIDENSSERLYNQVEVLYYNSKNNCAVQLTTNEGDLVILAKGDNGTTYSEIYENILAKAEQYEGDNDFTENDTLKIPKIDFNVVKSFDELTYDMAGTFWNSEGHECSIENAIQSIEFTLDETGGKVKSEALIGTVDVGIGVETEYENRYFEFDSTYSLFLVEDGQDVPYLALNIDDITLFQ